MKRLFAFAALCALLVPGIANAGRMIDLKPLRKIAASGSSNSYWSATIDTVNFHAASGDTIKAVVDQTSPIYGDFGLKMWFSGQINIKTTGSDSTIIEDGVVIQSNANFTFEGNTRIGRLGGKPVVYIPTGMRDLPSSNGGTLDQDAGITLRNGVFTVYNLQMPGLTENYSLRIGYNTNVTLYDINAQTQQSIRAPYVGKRTPYGSREESGPVSLRIIRCNFLPATSGLSLDMDAITSCEIQQPDFGSNGLSVEFSQFPQGGAAYEWDGMIADYLKKFGDRKAIFIDPKGKPVQDYIFKDVEVPAPGTNPNSPDALYYSGLQKVVQARIIVKTSKPNMDWDNDGTIGFGDFFLFAENFGKPASGNTAQYDLDNDGTIGFGDFFIFAENFGKPAGKPVAATKPVIATPSELAKLTTIWFNSPGLQRAIETLLPRETNGVFYDQLANALPRRIELAQNFPNPFNPTTSISYTLPASADVRLVVYNLTGQAVRTLVAEKQSAGRYNIHWNATDDSGRQLSSGEYFYRLTAGPFTEVRRMLFLK